MPRGVGDALAGDQVGGIVRVDCSVRSDADGQEPLHLGVVPGAERGDVRGDQVGPVDRVEHPHGQPVVVAGVVATAADPADRRLGQRMVLVENRAGGRTGRGRVGVAEEGVVRGRHTTADPGGRHFGHDDPAVLASAPAPGEADRPDDEVADGHVQAPAGGERRLEPLDLTRGQRVVAEDGPGVGVVDP